MSDLGEHKRSGVAVPVPRPAPRPAQPSPQRGHATARGGNVVSASVSVDAAGEVSLPLHGITKSLGDIVEGLHLDAFIEQEISERWLPEEEE